MNAPIYLSFLEKANTLIKRLPQKSRQLFLVCAGLMTFGTLGLLFQVNNSFLVTVPAHGGSLAEGMIGTPRFINPVLAISDADRDLTTLVYSGLMRPDSAGTLVPDIAQSYSISEDGLTYTFTLREDALFHDGTPVTSGDVAFTVAKAQDTSIKSPRRASWEGVVVETEDDKIVRFILQQPYAPFLENTTLGILPRHIWGDINSAQFGFSNFNTEAIGSGPYKIARVKRNASGVPEYYDLIAFKHFVLGEPYIQTLRLRFYPNERELLDAYGKGQIESVHAIPPEIARILTDKGHRVETAPLPRVFGVFFNQNQAAIFTDTSVRQALEAAINRDAIITNILHGYATPITGPLPPKSIGFLRHTIDQETEEETRIQTARNILEKNGWTQNEEDGIYEKKTKKGTLRLAFSLTTSDIKELSRAAELIRQQWNAIGADVTVKVYDIGELNQNIIRPRMYDALFFGEVIGRDADPFAFWHSSQRLDPGLNIALYANITVDSLLEEARESSESAIRAKNYELFQEEIGNDTPAVFIYAPDFIYIIPHTIKGFGLGSVAIPSERFAQIHHWYIKTDRVWEIFTNKYSTAGQSPAVIDYISSSARK